MPVSNPGKPSKRTQHVLSHARVLQSSYLTKKGLRLKSEGASASVLAKYTKNRYRYPFGTHIVKPLKHEW